MNDLFTIEHHKDSNTIMFLSSKGREAINQMTFRIATGEITKEEADEQIKRWVMKETEEGRTHAIVAVNYSEN